VRSHPKERALARVSIVSSIVVAEPYAKGQQERFLHRVQRHHTRRKETPSESKRLLQILMVNGLDAAPFIKFDPPTAWGSSPNDKSRAVTIFGMTHSSPCAHSNAITQRQRVGRFLECVRFGTHVPGYLRSFPRAELHLVRHPPSMLRSHFQYFKALTCNWALLSPCPGTI
jgi:hypothetical protein